MNIQEMRYKQKAMMMYRIVNGNAQSYLIDIFKHCHALDIYNLRRSKITFELTKNRTLYYNSSFAFTGAKLWNSLLDELKDAPSLKIFVKMLDSTIFCAN